MTGESTYETVIGLEVHAHLLTESKMFCPCSTDYIDAAPNTHVCPICLGMPGTLPVINKKAVEYTVMTALALSCTIPEYTRKIHLPCRVIVPLFQAVGRIGKIEITGTAEDSIIGGVKSFSIPTVRNGYELSFRLIQWSIHQCHTTVAMLTKDQLSMLIKQEAVASGFTSPGNGICVTRGLQIQLETLLFRPLKNGVVGDIGKY